MSPIPKLSDKGKGRSPHHKLPDNSKVELDPATCLDRTSESQDTDCAAETSSMAAGPLSDATASAPEKRKKLLRRIRELPHQLRQAIRMQKNLR